MCYDMCLRALDDAIQTFGSMKYRAVGQAEASNQAAAEVAAMVARLAEIRRNWRSSRAPTWTRPSSATPATSITITTTRRPSGAATRAATDMTTTSNGRHGRTAPAMSCALLPVQRFVSPLLLLLRALCVLGALGDCLAVTLHTLRSTGWAADPASYRLLASVAGKARAGIYPSAGDYPEWR